MCDHSQTSMKRELHTHTCKHTYTHIYLNCRLVQFQGPSMKVNNDLLFKKIRSHSMIWAKFGVGGSRDFCRLFRV